MPLTGIPGDVLMRWRLARGWKTLDMAVALRAASEETLIPTNAELARMVTKWEAGARRPSEGYLLLYHRVFPDLGRIPPPDRIAVFGGPGQPADPAGLLAEAGAFPGIEYLARVAEEKLAEGADPERVRALQETIGDLQRKAGDLAVVLAAMTGEDDASGDARAG